MKLSNREDIEAPLDHVFSRVSDFGAFERRAMREGAKINRHSGAPVAVGAVWHIRIPVRGREREFVSTLTALDGPDSYLVTTRIDGLDFTTQVVLVSLSPRRTRVAVGIEIRARTLAARLLLQSLKLAKSRLNERLKARMGDYAQGIEDDYRKNA
ncbi:SRPBCC family protein [Yoonia sp.]|uniref:SRPBCC family protein n=1 Tax=Yoonia sp. TaxID=2212373 RepID=UPI00391AD243